MQLNIKIQSVSDVVTNSSSEIFSVVTNMPKKELQSLLEKIHFQFEYKGNWEDWEMLSAEEKLQYDESSGMGGLLEVRDFDDYYQYELSLIPENKKHLFTKEVCAIYYDRSLEELEKELNIDIDFGFVKTINWIIENLFVTGCDYPVVKNKEGRVIKLLGYNKDSYIVDDNGNKIE